MNIQEAKESIQQILDADRDTSTRKHEKLFKVNKGVAKRIFELTGVDVSGYRHSIDKSEVNHAKNRHSSRKIEESRGQIPITNEDFLLIPEVVDSPNRLCCIGKDDLGRSTIVFEKAGGGGTMVVYAAVLTGKKEIAFQTLFKKKVDEFMQGSPTPTPETTFHFF